MGMLLMPLNLLQIDSGRAEPKDRHDQSIALPQSQWHRGKFKRIRAENSRGVCGLGGSFQKMCSTSRGPVRNSYQSCGSVEEARISCLQNIAMRLMLYGKVTYEGWYGNFDGRRLSVPMTPNIVCKLDRKLGVPIDRRFPLYYYGFGRPFLAIRS